MANPIAAFFNWVGSKAASAWAAFKAAETINQITLVLTAASLAVGVKGFMQARQMMAKGQDILANKTSAGGKLPVIYGTRRVGAQVIYMDVSANDSRDLYVVYALSVGECDEILGRTIELDGNPLTDTARFRDGGYIGSDKISSGSGSLNTVSQNGTGINAGAGQFGTSPTQKYRYVMNLHHGGATQLADPMLVASMPNWTFAHKLNGVAYIAFHAGYDKEGIWSGVPQLTVQVRGKKVFDPRDSGQTFGTVSTYKYSDNPALTFLDYISNNEYGKGLTQSQINMTTFSSAANVCDTEVDQPYFNGSAKSLTWSGNAGDDFITIGGNNPNTNWWQNKVGEIVDINDANGNLVIDGKEIKDVQRNGFYDQNDEYIVYINDTLGSTYSTQAGTSLVKVKRFHCNGYLDANKNVMDNAKELLANMRGIFLYINGKYELSIEDTGTSTFSINDNHIISDAGISVDYGNKDKKANKVIIEFFNANKRYELDTATVLHDASPEYYSDDGDEILEIKAEFPYISDPYIAYNMGKAILTRSRNQTALQFLGTPEMYKLNVGDIVDLTYAGLGFSGKVCRVEALELQASGLVAVSLIEYFDVYTWEVPPQEPVEELSNLPSAYAVKAPTGLSFTDSNASSTDRPFISWNIPTDFPDAQYRINVKDSSNNQVLNKIVNVNNADLNFLPTGTNYVASITSLNTLGTESSPTTLTFTVGDAPVGLGDVQANVITANEINVTNLSAISANLGSITAGDINIGSGNFTVSTAGAMTATGATISGGITATSLNVTNATITGTLDASVITLNGDPLDDLFGVSGTGSAKTLAIGPDIKNQLKVTGTNMQYIAYDQTQSDGDLAFKMDEDSATFYPQVGGRVSWSPTRIVGGDIESNTNNGGLSTPNLTVGYTSLNQTYNLAVAGTAFFNAPLLLDTVSTPSTTTNKLYNVGGSLYFNGSAVGGGGTSTTINNNADNRIITGSGTANTLNAEGGLTYNGSALSVSGTIIVTGTVDGRDIATDGSKLDGIESGATADQTQAQINALGITAIGLSGSPNITVGTISSGAITSTGNIAGATIEGYTFPSFPSVSGYLLRSDTSGNLQWTANAISSYTNSQDDRVITSTGSTGINAESTLTYNTTDGLEITGNSPKLTFDASLGGSEINLDTTVQGFINFKHGSTVDASIGYEGVFNNKFVLSSTTIRLSGAVEMSGALTLSNTAITGVNQLAFNDPGVNEGIEWTGGNIKIFESPDNLTNAAGNLQVVYGGTRRLTVNNSGIDVNGTISSGAITSTGFITGTRLRVGDGTDGYFYSDTAGRTAFSNGEFYIQTSVPNFYNYATNQYYGGSSGDTIHFRGNVITADNWGISAAGTITCTNVRAGAAQSRVKLGVWSDSTYGIGMHNACTYGGLNNDYAMTFQMNSDNDRGFLWLDSSHTLAQGAMALTTNGLLTVASGIRVGYGETDTTIPSAGLTVAQALVVGTDDVATEGDANITVKEGNAFAGIDLKSLRTSGNIGGIRSYNSSNTRVSELLFEVGGRVNYIGGGGIALGGTTFVDGSRNLTNIGTINSGTIDIRDSAGTADRRIHIPRSGGITFYGDSSTNHSIFARDRNFTAADDLRINSYGALYINLDSNSNNAANADLVVGRHGGSAAMATSQDLLVVNGENGNVNIAYDNACLTFGIPSNGANVQSCWASMEGNTDTSGEGSGRLFFREHNSTVASGDAYGMSLGYRGGADTVTTALGNQWTGLSQISNGQWGMWGHNGDGTGALVMSGDRAATFIDFHTNSLNNILGVTSQSFYGNSNSARLSANTVTSYATWKTSGSKGGYDGIVFDSGGDVAVMFDGSGNGGHYRQANSRWYDYHHVGNNCTGFGASTTASAYQIYVSGAIYATGNITAYSDRRIKENIITIDKPLTKVETLRGVYYNKINDTDKTKQIGFIAQEVNEVVPELVTYAEDVDQYGVNYGNATALLVEAVKELSQQVKDQQKQIDDLKQRLDNDSSN